MTKPKLEWISLKSASKELERHFHGQVDGGRMLLDAAKRGLISVRGVVTEIDALEYELVSKPRKHKLASDVTTFARSKSAPPLASLKRSASIDFISNNMIVLGDGEKTGSKRVLARVRIPRRDLDLFGYFHLNWQVAATEGRTRAEQNWRALLLTLVAMERYGRLTNTANQKFADFQVDVETMSGDIVNSATAKADLSAVHKLFVKDGGGALQRLAPTIEQFDLVTLMRPDAADQTEMATGG